MIQSPNYLIAQINAFSGRGGGESAIRRIYGRLTDATVWYLVDETCNQVLGSHVFKVKQKLKREIADKLRAASELTIDVDDFAISYAIAEAVKGNHFDAVEVPDYCTYLRFLPAAFELFGVGCDRFVLSLHGRVSKSLSYELYPDEVNKCKIIARLQRAEQSCFSMADTRYAISEMYKRELGGDHIQILDPFFAMSNYKPPLKLNKTKVELAFIGRLERIKGLHCIVGDVWYDSEFAKHHTLNVYGADVRLNGYSNRIRIKTSCSFRGVNMKFWGELDKKDLMRVYNSRTVVLVPSLGDSFNLVALEALFSACPVIVSRNAGVFEFLKQSFPNEEFHCEYLFGSPADNIENYNKCLNNYNKLSKDVREAMDALWKEPNPADFVKIMASEPNVLQSSEREQCGEAFGKLHDLLNTKAKTKLHTPMRRSHVKKKSNSVLQLRETKIDNSLSEVELEVASDCLRVKGRIGLLDCLRKRAKDSGDYDISGAYGLRMLRYGKKTERNFLDEVSMELRQLGKIDEAEILYPIMLQERTSIESLIKKQRQLVNDGGEGYVFVEDHRVNAKYKVSIIVSLYSVCLDQLRHFAKMLSCSKMVRRREAEIVLIDSGSPEQLFPDFSIIPEFKAMDYIFARAPQRETIQKTWNRGLKICKADCLVMLGVDEGVTADALDILYDNLEADPDLDWVVGSSIVTEVDQNGSYIQDKMFYDRAKFTHVRALLDTTYYGYVGGMYRKRIHDRFGYYDSGFRGAGDTEFKCRILPDIKLKALPMTLGVFYDYPEDRVTCSAMIEIEDLKAWYLYKTRAAVRFQFRNWSDKQLIDAFWDTLTSERCSSRAQVESDIRLASHFLSMIVERDSAPIYKKLFRLSEKLVSLMKRCQRMPYHNMLDYLIPTYMEKTHAYFYDICGKFRSDLNFPASLDSDIFYSEHFWLWKKD